MSDKEEIEMESVKKTRKKSSKTRNEDDNKEKSKEKKLERKRRKKKLELEESDSLNNSTASNILHKSDNEENRIRNDISDPNKAKKKDINPAKEEKRKRRERKEKREQLGEKEDKNKTKEEKEENKNVIGVFVHECEELKMDMLISHPVVKVSMVNSTNGLLIQKSDPNRKVTSYYEDGKVSRILPLMTQPYDFRVRKDIQPKWEELLLFNDDFDLVIEKNKNLMLFFEIIDFVPMSLAKENYRKQKEKGGWYNIAWGFLKIREEEWTSKRFGEKVRLQLFKPDSTSYKEDGGNSAGIWNTWKNSKRMKYPSTLWITIEPVPPPNSSEPTLRSMAPTQPELGFKFGPTVNDGSPSKDEKETFKWSRLPGQPYKLSVGIASQTTSHIRVYHIPSGVLVTQLSELYGLIYEIKFHKDGLMCAAVGDGSVPIWNFNTWNLVCKLSHPSYIYSASFSPKTSTVLVTAGFDRVIRIWRKSRDTSETLAYSVIQELSGHNSHITKVLFDAEAGFLFSGDHIGCIKVWEGPEVKDPNMLESSTDSYQQAPERNWSFRREYHVENPICNLSLHPGGRRLLVHRINPTDPLAMMDLRNGTFMQKYQDIQTFRVPGSSCISPCGTWVLAGSNSGYTILLNTDTGIKKHVYSNVAYSGPVSAVQFQPMENALAIASSQPFSKVHFFMYDKAKDAELIEDQKILSTPREEKSKYPFKQVAKLIAEKSMEERATKLPSLPVDLQDIVAKLNNAIREQKLSMQANAASNQEYFATNAEEKEN